MKLFAKVIKIDRITAFLPYCFSFIRICIVLIYLFFVVFVEFLKKDIIIFVHKESFVYFCSELNKYNLPIFKVLINYEKVIYRSIDDGIVSCIIRTAFNWFGFNTA